MVFKHLEIESKWQKYWEDNKTFRTDTYDNSKPKYYVLDMFPYPSGEGLHVGHPEGYTATDIVARYKRMQGYNVLHPMGWDAFGLPAEQYAVKTNNHPSVFTYKNIETFKKQVKMLGMSYDWDREVATCDTDFYKWTQWIFTELYKRDLAYVSSMPVNFCPELGTVLANEEVINGKSEVGGFDVIRKPMRQWVLKITEYAERLLEDLEDLDWPEATKQMQRNWIGKSEGANVDFKIANTNYQFTVFTTRPDTLFGATYCVLAPEHELVNLITTTNQKDLVEAYQEKVLHKSELERSELNKEKTGVFTGAYAINPVNDKLIPIYIADYVLVTYGTGAIMAVPAHDQRDYDFAKQFNLEIIPVIDGGNISVEAYADDGLHINSDFINGLDKEEAITKMIEWLETNNVGKKQISYKLRDWLFSRQRYWGEPIPIVFMEDGTTVCLEEKDLPLLLPEMAEFKPSGTGESPLANAKEWLEVEINGKKGKRETNTMPQWAGSCWYYIRYLDPHNNESIADSKILENWLPVDLYIGGAEHAVGHLLYARFWHKVLYDIGVVKTSEPFQRLFHQGMILGENNEKMSKSRGNVINPDDIVKSHGADSLRLHEMFMGPLDAAIAWSDENLDGARRWLDRVYRLFMMENVIVDENDLSLEKVYHQTVKKVTNDYDALAFNTAISQMMIFINEAYKTKKIYRPYAEGFIKMLSCICPHLGEELWQYLGNNNTIANEPWPLHDETKLIDNVITVVIQVNGKLRQKVEVALDTEEEIIKELALNDEHIKQFINDKEIVKIIYVKNKLLNIVVK